MRDRITMFKRWISKGIFFRGYTPEYTGCFLMKSGDTWSLFNPDDKEPVFTIVYIKTLFRKPRLKVTTRPTEE